MEISELGTWTIGWNRDKAHLFVDGETDVALCGNAMPRVNDRRLLVNPNWMTFVYLNNEAFCFPCVKVTRRRLEVRVDDFQLHYADMYGWSDDPKDISIITGPVDLRRGQDHHYHPQADLPPNYVEKYQTPDGVGYFWTIFERPPVRYVAVENVPSDMEADAQWRETLRSSRAADLGDSFTGHAFEEIPHTDLARLNKAQARQVDVMRWLSSHMPISKTKTGGSGRNGV